MSEEITIERIISLLSEFCDCDSAISEDTELLESGLLDSLAFIQLLSALEDIGYDIQPTQYPRTKFATPQSIFEMCLDTDTIR